MGDKYPILRPNEIISALSKKGFAFKSQKGSHAKYTNGHHTIVIPIHNTVARGTLKSILIQAGIELEEFMKLL
ncbi:MAG: type II toxin-antitoxin system HicA family toxin [Spirochaetaceae bacterium]|jgi:predicted RNA binding protein YcfA (HicA-like mRNA interferase family)|nr:type II toxin-antitoxin system HicA family toxin [Spirochaetaceae bacterium]